MHRALQTNALNQVMTPAISDIALLEELYKSYLQSTNDVYLRDHSSNNAVIRRQIDAFRKYRHFVFPKARILDWGCRHAIDSCLLRNNFGNEIELYACDVNSRHYDVFFDFAKLRYTNLDHPYMLPYKDNYFDVVIGSGVLEHVPDESASLRELYRILKPDGFFIITFLPNAFSYTELLNKCLGNFHHVRKYRVHELKQKLLQHGFLPILIGYHQVTPTLSSGMSLAHYAAARKLVELLYNLNNCMERLWPVNLLAANIISISKKKNYFSDSWD